jgi:hypothetical protein
MQASRLSSRLLVASGLPSPGLSLSRVPKTTAGSPKLLSKLWIHSSG